MKTAGRRAPARSVRSLSIVACAPLLIASAAGAQCDPAAYFGDAAIWPTFAPLMGFAVTAGDVDWDGDTDLVLGGFDTRVFRNNGNGNLTPGEFVLLGSTQVTLADLTGDGLPEVLTLGDDPVVGDNSVQVYGNIGGTIDGVILSDSIGTRTAAFPVADLVGDGAPDLVVAELIADEVRVFDGNGDGTFGSGPVTLTPSLTLPVGEEPRDIGVADLDADGDPDIVTVDAADGTASVLLRNPDGTYAPAVPYPVGANPHDLVLADLNGDGDDDLAVTNLDAATVTTLLGNGDGIFAAGSTAAIGAEPRDLQAGDINADGNTDLVAACQGAGLVSLLFGNGDGSFAPQAQIDAGGAPRSVALADFDGDLDLDLAAAIGDERLSTLENVCDPFVPVIVADPEGAVAAWGGEAQTLIVNAKHGAAFQWRFNGEPIADSDAYSGTSTSMLLVEPSPATEGFYDVVVTNLGGEATSGRAVLAVTNDCPADLNGDDILDLSDITSFIEAFTGGCP